MRARWSWRWGGWSAVLLQAILPIAASRAEDSTPPGAAAGGDGSAGRAPVVASAGAFYADAVIYVAPATGRFVGATLGPNGTVSAKPVPLPCDPKGTGYLPTADLTIHWFNETSGAREDIGGALDPTTMTRSALLERFCTCRADRAGC